MKDSKFQIHIPMTSKAPKKLNPALEKQTQAEPEKANVIAWTFPAVQDAVRPSARRVRAEASSVQPEAGGPAAGVMQPLADSRQRRGDASSAASATPAGDGEAPADAGPRPRGTQPAAGAAQAPA
ncbi:hypothetical protein HII30_02010, partial [Paenibacillus lemnae]|nr:hypothetical protein [Paenibacillus lemnae]